MTFTHEDQRRIWEAEHATPTVLLQMDSDQPSSGVERFYAFIQTIPGEKAGIEMACGKGRNVVWLSRQQGIAQMIGLDFSKHAITEAKHRALGTHAEFYVQDITERWPNEDASVDFVLDCFGTTDVESPEARAATIKEAFRVLKKGGHALVYVLSVDDDFHKEMIQIHPAAEANAFHHPSTGKFEKTFTETEIDTLYGAFKMLESERVEKTAVFNGKEYGCKHFWKIYQKV